MKVVWSKLVTITIDKNIIDWEKINLFFFNFCVILLITLLFCKYITGPSSTVNTPKIKHNIPKRSAVLEDELTTVENGTVVVAPDGTVKVKKNKKKDKNVR